MTGINTGLMDLLARKMSYLNEAQTVRAENVANANTPGYKAYDVAPFTFGDALKQANVSMTVTNAHHILPVSLTSTSKVAIKPKGRQNSDPLDVEQESTKVAQTGIEYQTITTLYKKISSFFKMALKGSA